MDDDFFALDFWWNYESQLISDMIPYLFTVYCHVLYTSYLPFFFLPPICRKSIEENLLVKYHSMVQYGKYWVYTIRLWPPAVPTNQLDLRTCIWDLLYLKDKDTVWTLCQMKRVNKDFVTSLKHHVFVTLLFFAQHFSFNLEWPLLSFESRAVQDQPVLS